MSGNLDNKSAINKIILAVVIGGLLGGIGQYGLSAQHATLLGIVAFLVTLWTNEGLPMGVVSLLPLLIFPSFELVGFNEVTVNYSNPIIFLFIGGFLLALAIEKTELHLVIAAKLLSIFPATPRGIVYSLTFSSALMSALLSNTTVTLILAPIAVLLTARAVLKTRFLLAVAYGASIGGVMTPIGTPPNLIYLGFITELGLSPIGFVDWIALTAPLTVAMLMVAPYLLSVGVSDQPVVQARQVDRLTVEQTKVAIVVIALALLLLVNSSIEPYYGGLGLNEKCILLGAGLLLFVPGLSILDWSDFKNFPYEIIFLFGAGFSISMAFIKTGLATEIVQPLHAFKDLPQYLLLLLLALSVSLATNITSNTALTSIIVPIFYEFAKANQLNQDIVMLTATVAASYAFILPIGTPPNAIIMSFRIVKTGQLARFGFAINIVGVLLLASAAFFYWNRVL
ncbi:MAG: SLC13 family permease [Gammaproteobacteria bacterium]